MRIDYEYTFKVELQQYGLVFRVWETIAPGISLTLCIKTFISNLKVELENLRGVNPNKDKFDTEALQKIGQRLIGRMHDVTAIEIINVYNQFAAETFPLANVSRRGIVVYKDFPQSK